MTQVHSAAVFHKVEQEKLQANKEQEEKVQWDKAQQEKVDWDKLQQEKLQADKLQQERLEKEDQSAPPSAKLDPLELLRKIGLDWRPEKEKPPADPVFDNAYSGMKNRASGTSFASAGPDLDIRVQVPYFKTRQFSR
jgi:fused signal recognition particle receptor